MEGAEGKIKGGGVTTMLTHCLHIGFRGSTAKGLGVTVFALFPTMLGKSSGCTLFEAYALSLRVTDSTWRKCLEKVGIWADFKLASPWRISGQDTPKYHYKFAQASFPRHPFRLNKPPIEFAEWGLVRTRLKSLLAARWVYRFHAA